MSITLIRNGRVITATDDYVADVLMQDGVIHAIGTSLAVGEDVRIIDASGLYVLPGGVDTHVHLQNIIGPTITCDTFASGTRAAAFGGTTTVVDFALQTAEDSPLEAIARAQRLADPQVNIDYSLHVIVTRVDAQVLADVRHAMRHEGVTSFKMFMAYPGVMMADDAAIFQMLRQVGAEGGMVALHAENGTVIDLLIKEALEAGHTSPRYHALTRPAILRAKLRTAASGWQSWPRRRSTLSMSRRTRRSSTSSPRAPRGFRCLPKPVRTTCCSTIRSTTATSFRLPNM